MKHITEASDPTDNTSAEALAAWERYCALPVNPGTEGYTAEQCEQDAFTAGFDAGRAPQPTGGVAEAHRQGWDDCQAAHGGAYCQLEGQNEPPYNFTFAALSRPLPVGDTPSDEKLNRVYNDAKLAAMKTGIGALNGHYVGLRAVAALSTPTPKGQSND